MTKIIDEATIRGVHYVLAEGKRGKLRPMDNAGAIDYFRHFFVYAIYDGHGEELDRWSIPDGMYPGTKIHGVIQGHDGKWQVRVGSPNGKFFGEKPFKTPCGQEPEVCCKHNRSNQRKVYAHPFIGWLEATCDGCGRREAIGEMPTADWSDGVGSRYSH